MNAHLIQKRQMEIRKRGWLVVLEVPGSPNVSSSSPSDEYRQVGMIVNVWVPHATAQQDQ